MLDVVPVLSNEQALAYERDCLRDEAGVAVAMSAAGEAIARAVRRDFAWWRPWPEAGRQLLVLAGKGHNGGDALLAARHLVADDAEAFVQVVLAAEESALKPLTAAAMSALREALGERLEVVSAEVWSAAGASGYFDVTLDGLLGASAVGPTREPITGLLAAVRRCKTQLGFRVAVDLPSGLTEDPASVETAFSADVTYALGIVKTLAVARHAITAVGRLRFLSLGFFRVGSPIMAEGEGFVTSGVLFAVQRLRPVLSDKRNYGRIFVLAGSREFPGAALMACQAAVRGGGGLVTGLVPQNISNRLTAGVPEAMWMPLPVTAEGSFETASIRTIHQAMGERGVLLLGPGLHTDRTNTFFLSRLVRESALPLVIDAGALNADTISAVMARSKASGPVVVTPHVGEFQRMTNTSTLPTNEEIRAFAAKYQLVVVLKGPISIISDGERVYHAAAGNPVLARGGSGDVLAGLIAARLAFQPEASLRAVFEAVKWHGEAADALARARGETGVRTTEILDYLAPALRGLTR